MYIAHANLKPQKPKASCKNKGIDSIRYQAYLAACKKHHTEIAAIQKYLPGWLPPFRSEQIGA